MGIRWSCLCVLAILPLVAGCPTEVPYVPPGDADSAGDEEAPPFEATEEPSADTAAEPAVPPASEDRYATPAEPPTGLPWESDKQDEEASAEADRLFAGAYEEVTAESTPEDAAADEEPADDDGGDFGDLLGEAYAGLVEQAPEETPEPAKDTIAATDPPEVVSPDDLPSEEPPTFNAEELFGSQAESALPPAEPETSPAVMAKEPTTTAPADSDLLAELWGDEPLPEEPASEGEGLSEAEVQAEPELPPPPSVAKIEEADEPTESQDPPPPTVIEASEATTAEELFAFDEPSSTADEPAEDDWVQAVEEPSTLPEPDNEPAPRLASRTPQVDRPTPMASAAIKPLPAVPVLPYNTRHLAWLLGGKLGLAELADLDGATPTEVAAWSDEVDRLARELQIPDPSSKTNASDPAERVRRMMDAAARAGDALATEHGIDHAALLEISLKTNALLVVAKERPELAAPVATAVRAAAERAVLPRFLWEEAVQTLERQPTPEQTLATVTKLHERVESFLR